MDQERIRQILAEHGLKASRQRIRILDYLVSTETHPTADEIFRSLNQADPVLSMATVYNTLNSFVDARVISALDVRGSETRYDAAQDQHAHFRCSACEKIFNLPLETDCFTLDYPGYRIDELSVTLRGLCPSCRSRES